jgi:hypothetical protein
MGKEEAAADFTVIITDKFVRVEYPGSYLRQVSWSDIQMIKLVTTDEGAFELDFWLVLLGKKGRCSIPLGAEGYEEVYDIVSAYKGFDVEVVKEAKTCLENEEFLVWAKKSRKEEPGKMYHPA